MTRSTDGYAYAVYETNNGRFTFTRSHERLSSTQVDKTITSINGVEYTGIVIANVETDPASLRNAPRGACQNASRVTVEDGVLIQPRSMDQYFTYMYNATYVDLNGFDLRYCTTARAAFQNCSSLRAVSFYSADDDHVYSNDETPLRDTSYMFANCYALRGTSLPALNTSNVENMSYMYSSCYNLMSVDLKHNNFSKVRDMSHMFQNCYQLKRIDASYNEGNRKVMSELADTSYMFASCVYLTNSDLGWWVTPKLTNAENMFSENYATTIIDVSGWDFSRTSGNGICLAGYIGSSCSTVKAQETKFGQHSPFEMIGDWQNIRYADFSKSQIATDSANSPVEIKPSGIYSLHTIDFSYATMPYVSKIDIENAPSLTSISFKSALMTQVPGLAEITIKNLSVLSNLDFQNMQTRSPKSLDISMCPMLTDIYGLDRIPVQSGVTQRFSFEGDSLLKSLDLSAWNMSADPLPQQNDAFAGMDMLNEMTLSNTFRFDDAQDSGIYPSWHRTQDELHVDDIVNEKPQNSYIGTWLRDDTESIYDITEIDASELSFEDGNIIIDTEAKPDMCPVDASTWSVAESLAIHLGEGDLPEELATLLPQEGDEEPRTIDVQMRSHVYAAVTACISRPSTDPEFLEHNPDYFKGSVIWTFDIPYDKENPPSQMTIEMWADDEGELGWNHDMSAPESADDVCPFEFYRGCVTNDDPENPYTFHVYDKDGNLIDTVTPNMRHTKGDIYYQGADTPMLPEYEAYVTYRKGWANYEIPSIPGYYRFDITTNKVATLAFDSYDEEEGQMMLSTTQDVSPNRLRMFNILYKTTKHEDYTFYESTSYVSKRDADSSGSSVSGGLYSFRSTSTGKTWYSYSGPRMTPMYSGLVFDNETYYDGISAYDLMPGEIFIVQEVVAPTGYYKSNDLAVFMYKMNDYATSTSPDATVYLVDGTSLANTPANAKMHYYYKGDGYVHTNRSCAVCSAGKTQCICHNYPMYRVDWTYDQYLYNDNCSKCGNTESRSTTLRVDTESVYDRQLPKISVNKVDESGRGLAGARLQLIDIASGDIIDEWTSDGSAHLYTFEEDSDYAIPNIDSAKRDVIVREVAPPSDSYKLAPDQSITLTNRSGTRSVTVRDNLIAASVFELTHKIDMDTRDAWGQGDSNDWSMFAVEIRYYASPDCTGDVVSQATFGADEQGRILFSTTSPIAGSWPWKSAGANVIPVGSYELREVSAPEGYTINPMVQRFRVTADGVSRLD